MVDSASLKSDVDEIEIDKSKTSPINLSKLSNVVKNVAKKDMMMNWLKSLIPFRLMILVI